MPGTGDRRGRRQRLLALELLAGAALVAAGIAAAGAFTADGSARPAAALAVLPRATADRPDDVTGPQVHVVYAVPADLADRSLDTDGTIGASVDNWQRWLRGQAGDRGLRLDTAQGSLDVTFVRLGRTDGEIAARGAFVRDQVEADLRARGLVQAGKLYAVYYDGTSTYACGGGAWPPTLPGVVAAVYMRSTQPGFPCYDPTQSRARITYMDYAILHELIHTLGLVATCARNHTRAGHTSDDPRDLMYAGDQGWVPSLLDAGHDDYYGHSIAGCPDLARSEFLETSPQPGTTQGTTTVVPPKPKPAAKPVPRCKPGQRSTPKRPCRR